MSKLSNIAFALMMSSSFSVIAETVILGSEAIAEADIVVTSESRVGITITPVANLTVKDILKGDLTDVAKFTLTGSDVAVRLLDASLAYPTCAYLLGAADKNNKIEVCLKNANKGSFKAGNYTYYKYPEGEHIVRGGNDNKVPSITSVRADTYKLAMEAIKYTM